MNGFVLCSSGLSSKARAAVTDIVTRMGGRYVHDLSKSVTHLIVGPNGIASEKHKAAIASGICCVTEDWINSCEDAKEIKSTEKYQVHYFLATLVICVTGTDMSNEQRLGISNLVREGGGRYEADMQGGVCTHLIASEPHGRKWDMAQNHPGTFIVTRNWLLDCIRLKGSFLIVY